VAVTLAATDNSGGSGVSSTHYTTDGTNPTLTSPTYTGPFTVAVKTQVRYASWDVSGNAEGVKSRDINVTDYPPVARLTVTPTSGVFPFSVTADASASTDTDATPISNYQFNFGDGTSLAPQTGATATHTYTKAGPFTVTVTVRDTANLSSKATVQVVVSS
jgi:PKD repeat protein